MKTFSYHIFYFPFKWEVKKTKNCEFSEQINLEHVDYSLETSGWERTPALSNDEKQSLYNEKNYYYPFVHPILYDEEDGYDLIRHFERKETKNENVFYFIKKKGRELPYELKVDAINLNLYSTGVGLLSFFLKNEREDQSNPNDILYINQYGRRVLPPFYNDVQRRDETSEYISIRGLWGDPAKYIEDFKLYRPDDYWKPGKFVCSLINDLNANISYEPIIDDRMFVVSWYKNDILTKSMINSPEQFINGDWNLTQESEMNKWPDFWYRYLFIDTDYPTCQHDGMKRELLKESSYVRWQGWGSLYGISKYSMIYLTSHGAPEHLINGFQTIYARMVELVLVQRASMLCFSGEITEVSKLSNQEAKAISIRINSIYKEYIRFVNQIYFREVTAQDQGIELYTMLHKSLRMKEYIEDLDKEIGELYNYVSMIEEREQNKKAAFLNNIATLFIPITVITGFFGMNAWCELYGDKNQYFWEQVSVIAIGTIIAGIVIYFRKKNRL